MSLILESGIVRENEAKEKGSGSLKKPTTKYRKATKTSLMLSPNMIIREI